MLSSRYTTNLSNSLRVIDGAQALSVTIGATPVLQHTEPLMAIDSKTEFLQCQVIGDAVWLNLHRQSPAGQGNAFTIAAGTIFILSKSEWKNSSWLRVESDAILTAMQMGAG
jgi:hypothetical protein